MLRRISVSLVALAGALGAATAAADISYSYGVVTLSSGRVTGSFTATEAAIADGILTASELSAQFTFSETSAPYVPAEFTAAEFGDYIFNPYYGEIYVDRVSGEPYSGDFSWGARDTATGQGLGLTSHSVSVSLSGGGGFVSAEAPLTVSGGGTGAGGGGPGGGPGQNITYTFTTTLPAAQAGALSGSFAVPKAAIADGTIAFSDILFANFVLPGATEPFTPITVTLADFRPLFLTPRNTREVRVDPVSGAFLHDFQLSAAAPGTNATTLELFPHRYAAWPASGAPPSARGEGRFTVSGGGVPAGGTDTVELPALHPLASIALALMLLLFVARAARAARR